MSALVLTLTNIVYQTSRYGLSTLFALGILGSILNIILFSRKQLRQISCCTCMYNNFKHLFEKKNTSILDFLAASCANIVSLSWGIIPTLYSLNNVYPGSYSLAFCKIQGYLTHTSLQMTRVFLVLACFDRFALSSTNAYLRQFSQVKVAHRSISITVICCLLIAIHLAIYLNLVPGGCGLTNTIASIYNSLYTMLTVSILIPVSMFVLSILTFYHLKQRQNLRRQMQQQRSTNQEITRDQKIFFVLMMQLSLYFISTVLYAPAFIYGLATANVIKSFERQIIESFIGGLSVTLIYLYPALSFFAFTLASKSFRLELRKLLRITMSYRLQRIQIEPEHLQNTTNKTNITTSRPLPTF